MANRERALARIANITAARERLIERMEAGNVDADAAQARLEELDVGLTEWGLVLDLEEIRAAKAGDVSVEVPTGTVTAKEA